MYRKNKIFELICGVIIVACVLSTGIILVAGADYSGRTIIQSGWQVLRAEGLEDTTTIDLTTKGNYANKPTKAKVIPDIDTLSTTARKIALISCAGEAPDKTYKVTHFGWAAGNGPAQRKCEIYYTTGTQAVVKYPYGDATATNKYWADTAVVVNYGALPIEVSDGLGENGVAEVTIPTEGLKYWYTQVTDANGSVAEANNVTVYWRPKN